MSISTFSKDKYSHLLKEVLPKHNIFIGTSSWNYEGWIGQVYNGDYSGKRSPFSKKVFEERQLKDYSEAFSTVCFDGAYYGGRNLDKFKHYYSETPSDFVMAIKATDLVTIRKFPKVPRWQSKGGELNSTFLDARTFTEEVLKPAVQGLKEKLGPVILEFSPIEFGSWKAGNYEPIDFVKQLHKFFEQIPKDEVKLAVEVRDPVLIDPSFKRLFDCLEYHGVSYVLNEQTNMPSIAEQMEIDGIYTSDFTVIRALVERGTSHQEAVEKFSPYKETAYEMPQLRMALANTIKHSIEYRRGLYMYVNNRTEGNAPNTIAAILDLCEQLELFDIEDE